MASACTTSPAMSRVRRSSAKSRVTVASGAMTRSTEEWEMSRSCHSATFSSAGTTAERTRRARPVRFSLKTGLRLWGIAEEPFWPAAKGSSASRTSLRCKCRISVARRSTELAITARVAKNMAWRSRGMTWLEIGSTSSPRASATWASTRGSTSAKVPTAPEMAQVAISRWAWRRRSRLRSNSA